MGISSIISITLRIIDDLKIEGSRGESSFSYVLKM
jgi:hypothetical protein